MANTMTGAPTRYLRELRVLEQLAHTQHSQTLSMLAQRLDLPKTSLMRLLATLVEAGFVIKAPGEQGFLPGPRAARLAVSILSTPYFSRSARAILSQLVGATGESCNLTALEGDSMRYLERVETHHPLRLSMEVGAHVPLHCTATGKLMLAFMDDAARQAVLDRITLASHTPRTLTQRDVLEQDLAITRQRGIGIDHEEFILGMVAVAVPVFDGKGRMIAAIASHGPTARVLLPFLLNQIPRMRDAAERMEKVFADTALSPTPPAHD
ncbi:IclR family transcriptional regulator [Castellaniella sp.]|uniref:IclR family transcriptional regulator n=1 Tax=Castellaniella sp. TaxID=1955812 RepID=UPI003C75B09D